ncbi:helical backbone metal receptor [Nocardia farcinica]|uniref:helical backbone metal receptor n=1 Tax=Nocardia farcinica TaxID=37329 RepID=UPI0009EA55CC|nr:helical backbone metal receptor [Nocardia farcinica]MBA4857294.1 cobalamin-binding protein [Nocardia farcinica]MBC9817588.1 cobalamin-binding protein [Nocardia farcinica]MBF6069614.1 cobalamin-binding protein [Nocardia farcinica]MBF6268594.1 cobalamin-binding protein [Nocardia farcinica]MBF6361445.1 cobalamin-binding protein [Nocardia farcinica]
MTAVIRDDLGAEVPLSAPARRVVSLVPSLTEAVAHTCPETLVAATRWCTHPAELAVERVRGTKNPDVRRIVALAPDLVLCNQEENRRLDVDRLRAAGVPVWVTRIETLAEAVASLARLFTTAFGHEVPAWLAEAENAWAAPPPRPPIPAVIPVWRNPWMVVGRDTFTGDLAARLGLHLVHADRPERYPTLTDADLTRGVDLAVLPDEPYVFTADDGPDAFPGIPVALVEGRALTWYGPSLTTARSHLTARIEAAIG